MGNDDQSWWQRLLARFQKDEPLTPEELERLRAAFKNRYNSFRLLLTANNRALEIMTEMERSLEGADPIDMAFVRSSCTRVAASVLQMVGHMQRIAPGKYDLLSERFEEIQGRIQSRLDRGRPDEELPLVLPFARLSARSADQVGSKMALLAELGRTTSVRVPPGFSTTTRASRRFFEHGELETEINRVIQAGGVQDLDDLSATSKRLQRLVRGAEVPDDLAGALREHYREIERAAGEGVVVALRSSALGEDELGLSHAGMYDSVFGVTGQNLLDAFKEVLASKYSARAIRYRLEHGIRTFLNALTGPGKPLKSWSKLETYEDTSGGEAGVIRVKVELQFNMPIEKVLFELPVKLGEDAGE